MYIPKSPIKLCLDLTSQCNIKCDHCVANADSNGISIPPDIAHSIIDEAKSIGVRDLVLGGGEVLLYKEFFEICEYALSGGLNVSFTTNGLLIPEKEDGLRNLNKYDKQLRIGISLDGYTPEMHGYFRPKETFEPAIEAINILQNNNISVHVLCVLNSVNISYLENFLKFISELHVKNVRLIPLMPLGRGKKHTKDIILADDLHFILKKKQEWNRVFNINIGLRMPWDFFFLPADTRHLAPCEAGYLRLWINSNGNMFPCAYMQDYPIGNIYKDSISDVWMHASSVKTTIPPGIVLY